MNKTNGDDEISTKVVKILKIDAARVLHSTCQQIWKNQQWSQGWQRCFCSNGKERQCQRMFKSPYNCTHSYTTKLILKILQAMLQQYLN